MTPPHAVVVLRATVEGFARVGLDGTGAIRALAEAVAA